MILCQRRGGGDGEPRAKSDAEEEVGRLASGGMDGGRRPPPGGSQARTRSSSSSVEGIAHPR